MKLAQTIAPTLCAAVALCLASTAGFAADAPKGLVLHFDFDGKEEAGSTADDSGRGNAGRVEGAKAVTDAMKGKAYRFAASGSAIRVPDSPSLRLGQFTLNAWVKAARSASIPRHIFDKGGVVLGIGGAETAGGAAKDKIFAAINGKPLCFGEKTVTDDRWHHVAATYDGATLRLYYDGTPVKPEAPCTDRPESGTGDLLIGAVGDQVGPDGKPISLDGVLDELSIFDRALPAEEVKGVAQAIDPAIGKAKYTKRQVLGRYGQLKRLFLEGLLTDDFFEEQVKELEAGLEEQ